LLDTEIRIQDQQTGDLRDLFLRYWRYWRLILACVVLSTIGFASAAIFMTPIYRGSVVLISASSDKTSLSRSLSSALGQLGGLASLAGVNVNTVDEGTQEALAVLRSRDFSERFISDKKLLPILFDNKWDPVHGEWTTSISNQPTLGRAFKYFDKKIRTVLEDKKTDLITLEIDWKDRVAAASWANELVDRLNAEMRERALNKANASLGYLQHELSQSTEIGVRDSINRLIEVQIQQRMLADVTREYAFRIVDKAMVPEVKDKISPNRPLLLICGPILGFFVGLALAAIANAFSGKRRIEAA
jgi:uncharacterized protein involved in exopolysaccharide biosynthesis